MMNEHWGYAATDQRWKSSALLVRRLVESVSKGGNYLLNVGPTPEGEIPQASVERLREIGAWLRVHGEAIYGAGPSCLAKTGNWRCTTKPGRVFIHLLAWPGTSLTVSGLPTVVTAAKLLGVEQPLPVSRDGERVTITVPAAAPATDLLPVVALDLAP
jgi:alpha-L-fucosidase